MKAVLLVLLFFGISVGYGQSYKQPVYRAQVTTHNGLQIVGVLTALGDSSLQFVPYMQFRQGKLVGEPELYTYRVEEIYFLSIRKKGAPGRTALIMGLGGMVLGGIAGYITYSPCVSSGGWFDCVQILDKKGATIAGGVLGATFGTGIGFAAGSSNKRYYIRGDFEIYRQMRSELTKYVYPLPLTAQSK